MFTKQILDIKPDIFEDLLNSIKFEDFNKNRKGAVITDCKNDLIPLVRTTTEYNNPAQKFSQIHYDIVNKIKEKFKDIKDIKDIKDLEFNNGLVEIYDNSYTKMGYHTDCSLDLKENSYICLFSCYDTKQDKNNIRKLKIKNKKTDENLEFLLENCSVILFSTNCNDQHLHKIVLENQNNKINTKWLGLTFRLSKTFIKFNNDIPYFCNINKPLKVATQEEKNQFLIHKSNENSNSGYNYPELEYTISKSDIVNIN